MSRRARPRLGGPRHRCGRRPRRRRSWTRCSRAATGWSALDRDAIDRRAGRRSAPTRSTCSTTAAVAAALADAAAAGCALRHVVAIAGGALPDEKACVDPGRAPARGVPPLAGAEPDHGLDHAARRAAAPAAQATGDRSITLTSSTDALAALRPAGLRGGEGGPARPGALAGGHARRRRHPHQRGRARRRADPAQRARVGARARLVRPAARGVGARPARHARGPGARRTSR